MLIIPTHIFRDFDVFDHFQYSIRIIFFLFAHVVDPDACLKAHNEKRALHPGTPMLVWNDTLAQHAKTWADHLASKGTLEHAENTREGENLYYFGTSGSYVATCDDAVQAW